MKALKVTLLFLGLLLFSLIVTLPASLILKEINLDKSIQMGAVNGVWWAFSIDWISYQGITFDKTDVSLNASCLLKAAVCVDLDNEQAEIHFKKPLFNGLYIVENSELQLSFSQLAPLMNALFVKPTGDVLISIQALELKQQTINNVVANIKWHSVGVQGETFNLGTIQSTVSHELGLLTFDLSDQSKKLDLTGLIKISKNGMIDTQIQLKTLASFPPSIKTALQSIMRKRGRDVFEFQSITNSRILLNSNINF